jgi:nucleoside-diphosphate-sugar epimerase
MRLLVTGAAGFVGLNLVRGLAACGRFAAILATDRHQTGAAEQAFIRHPTVTAMPLDVTDRKAVQALFKEWQPTHILHAAALTPGPDLSADEVTQVFDVNLSATINVFDAAARQKMRRVLALSSSGVYALSGGDTRQEDDPLALDQPYGASKHSAEIIARSYAPHIDIVAARLGPIYGAMERVRPTRPRMSLIGRLAAAKREGRRIRIAGDDVGRDWTYAADAIERLLVADHLQHRIYNLSSGQRSRTTEVISVFRSQGLDVCWTGPTDADLLISRNDERTPLSIARLTADTGFSPRWTLAAGIAATLTAEHEISSFSRFEESH